jgi:hypothetical protein
MREIKLNFKSVIWLALLLVTVLTIYTLITVTRYTVLEYPFVIEREVEVNNCVCIPCPDEPQWEKCIYEGLVYEAIADDYDIYGEKILTKGDVFTIKNKMFTTDNYLFCSEDDCFPPEVIIDKNYFKAIK